MPPEYQASRIAVTVLVIVAAAKLQAQDPPAADESTLAEKTHRFADAEVARYEFTIADSGVKLEQVPQSLIRWSNLTRKPTFGDTYVWTHLGCAKAIVSVYAIGTERMMALEFQSLCEQPLGARREDRVVWKPRKSGVSFAKLDGVDPPASTPARRISQMNSAARAFTGEFATHDSPDDFSELRLLPKPIYRYESRDPGVIDGAVYGFVESTDPEMLLVIEAQVKDGKPAWVYSGARSRHDHLRMYRDGRLVWEVESLVPPWTNIQNPEETYFNREWKYLAEPEERPLLEQLFDDRAEGP